MIVSVRSFVLLVVDVVFVELILLLQSLVQAWKWKEKKGIIITLFFISFDNIDKNINILMANISSLPIGTLDSTDRELSDKLVYRIHYLLFCDLILKLSAMIYFFV